MLASARLVKPISFEPLLEAIASALKQRSVMSHDGDREPRQRYRRAVDAHRQKPAG
jgi:hypothetical protein